MEAVARSADRQAFAELFAWYAPRVKAQAMRFGLSADAAEDVAQETMLSLWRRAGQFDRARGGASAWVFTIAVNARIDRLRRDQRLAKSAPLDGAALDIAAAAGDEAGLDGARLARLLADLPPDQRKVVHLAFYGGATQSEIADALGAPLGTVKSRLRLALQKLRAALGETS
ncbi:MAG: sigma-70 family RNA polymerase sigma factor [Methylobacteriaceae bacterium]|nr:sigma-70 family RNA polymerase sigma factor [Methylobacteriaceae bacterium]